MSKRSRDDSKRFRNVMKHPKNVDGERQFYFDDFMKKSGYSSKFRSGVIEKFQRFIERELDFYNYTDLYNCTSVESMANCYLDLKHRKCAESRYPLLNTPDKSRDIRKVWKSIYKKYVHSGKIRTIPSFIVRFAISKVLSRDIIAFYKYEAFPTLVSKEYRKDALLEFTKEKIKKEELLIHWNKLRKKIKKSYLPKGRKGTPNTVGQLWADLKSYARHGYFESQLNRATRELIEENNPICKGYTWIERSNGTKRNKVEMYIPPEIWYIIVSYFPKKIACSLMTICKNFYVMIQRYFGDYLTVSESNVWNLPPLLVKHIRKIRIKGKINYSSLDYLFKQVVGSSKRKPRVQKIEIYIKTDIRLKQREWFEIYFQRRGMEFPNVKKIQFRKT
jgi:hypothetical protein